MLTLGEILFNTHFTNVCNIKIKGTDNLNEAQRWYRNIVDMYYDQLNTPILTLEMLEG